MDRHHPDGDPGVSNFVSILTLVGLTLLLLRVGLHFFGLM
jgi:hypothetical protein